MHSFLNNVKTLNDFDNPDNYCLLLTVDDGNSANNQLIKEGKENFKSRNYITESIRCIGAWRKNGGFLKDISIIVDYIGESDLPREVTDKYFEYKVSLFQNNRAQYQTFMKEFTHGFVNVHLTGSEFNTLEYQHVMRPITIHIDLDMELLQPMTPDFFYPLINHSCIIGGYREEDLPSQRLPLFNHEILNSDLIVTKYYPYDKDNFHKPPLSPEKQYAYQNSGKVVYNNIIGWCLNINHDYQKYQNDTDVKDVKFRDFDIEEYGVDATLNYIRETRLTNPDYQDWYIVKEDSYEQGEGYFQVTDIDLSKVFFWHEHILDEPSEYFTKQKIKLVNAIRQYRKEKLNELKAIQPAFSAD